MLTKNLTPFLFGAKVCSRRPPQPEMTLVVRGTWKFGPGEPVTHVGEDDQGFLTGDVFDEDDDEQRGAVLQPSDFADYKLNAEVLLAGTCYAPGNRPVTECPVRLGVGSWSKLLRVVGQRVWSDNRSGAVMSAPIPFTKMPLGFSSAYGGPSFDKNPVGRGHTTLELPMVEAAGLPIRSRGDEPEPAGFGPLNPLWPQRARKVGKEYGRSYLEKRAPYYAEDFDWSYFQSALPDQQLKGYLRGDEEVSLQNLHPTAPTLTVRLPGLRVRVFVKDRTGRFREAPMSLDTLFVEPDKGIFHLTWRGLDEVREDDLSDVKSVLIASEPLLERPLPEAHYLQILEAFEKDPTGVLAEIPPELIALGKERDRLLAASDDEAPPVPPPGDGGFVSAIQGKVGKLGAAQQGQLEEMAKVLARPEIQSKVDVGAALSRSAQEAADIPPPVVPIKPGALPNPGLRRKMRAVMDKVVELKKAAAETGRPIAGLDKMEALPHDPRLKELDPTYSPPGPLSTDEPGPYKNLSEHDLAHCDLSGKDLRGANLEHAILTKANLRGANLRGANLKNALLFKTDLREADLTGADLSFANLAYVRAAGANFSEAILEQAFFLHANLAGANLTEASGEYVVFEEADLTGVKAARARLGSSDFSKALLERANFSNASLDKGLFEECRGRNVDMSGARLESASFEKADVTGARFFQARGEGSFWMEAILDGADFGYVVMTGAHFTEASAVGTRFFGANLRECRFYRATLMRAEIVQANLFGADLCKARLDGARFTNSNLYDAKLLQASGAGCDFTGANLKRSTLERT